MIFYPQERIGLFIDGSNLYAAARALGFDIDYKRLLELFSQKGQLIRAFYYTALIEDQEYSPIRPLVDWLDYNGYTMVTKPTKPPMVADELRRQADNFIELTELEGTIARKVQQRRDDDHPDIDDHPEHPDLDEFTYE